MRRWRQSWPSPRWPVWRPWLRDLRVFRPHQLADELEKLLHEKEVTGHSAWNRLFDETIAGMRIRVGGEALTVSAALNKLSDQRPRGARGRRPSHRRRLRRTGEAVLADHQHAGEGQGNHRHLAPLPASRQRTQSREHGGRRGRRCAGDRGARRLSAAGAPLLHDEGQVARAAEAAALGPQRAAAGRRRPPDRLAGGARTRAVRLWRVQPGAGVGGQALLRCAMDRRDAAPRQVRRRLRASHRAERASVSAAELPRPHARRDDPGA